MAHYDEAPAQVHEATQDIYSLDDVPGIDRVYHVKARHLNNAIQDIGMGRYQVRPRLFSTQQPTLTCCLHTVDALHSCGFWMVR